MDAGAFGRMSKGKLRPEARIDLHGMTLAEAYPALASFLLDARARGRRLVLVITGKGRARDDLAPMPARAGRLRHDVPRWLALPPLAEHVLQVAPAHRRHGGEGALYVYLRA
jgi:DNA-nicking Smr family endonuclease